MTKTASGYIIDKEKVKNAVDRKCSKIADVKKGISDFFKKLLYKLVMLITTLFIVSTILSSSNAEAASSRRRNDSFRSGGTKISAQYLDKKTGKKCSYMVKSVDDGKITVHIRYDNNNDGVINASDSLGGIPDGELTYSSKEALNADFNGGRFDNTLSHNSNSKTNSSNSNANRPQNNSTNSSNGAGIRAGRVYDF